MNYLDKTGLAYLWAKVKDLISTHTHNYAGSASAGGSAISANKLNTDAGSATQPVYFSNGVPVATSYSLGSACAKGVDTTVASGSGNLPTSSAVYTAVSNSKAKTSTLSLSVSGWTASGDVYEQTINASIVSTTSNVIVTPSPQYVDEYAESGIVCTSQGAGTLTFQCKTLPTETLTVNVMSWAV